MNTNVERTFQYGNYLNVTDKPVTKILDSQLDIRLEQFTAEELNVELTKIRSRKTAGLNEIPPEVWKTRKFDDLLLAAPYINKIQ